MGIDGSIFPVLTKLLDIHSLFAGDWFPVQISQVYKIDRPESMPLESGRTSAEAF